jgi:Spy/CpxP family protein refolding chaperone
MRTRLVMLTAALLFVARAVAAQTPQAPPAPAAPGSSPFRGTVDVGGLFTATDGDAARF